MPIMHAEKTRDSRGVDGVRRATAKSLDQSTVEAVSSHPADIGPPDPEVVARLTRRRFTAANKLRILKLADACTAVGSLGALLRADLGITKTHSRPYTSDDNPFSESQFKTLKYRPEFPERFGSLEDARAFCQRFFAWYNSAHRYTGIGLMPPAAVHEGRADLMQTARHQVLRTVYAAHPERFVNKPPQPPRLPQAVWINPPTNESTAQNGVGPTIAPEADPRVVQHGEGIGVVAEIVGSAPHTIMTSTDEVLH